MSPAKRTAKKSKKATKKSVRPKKQIRTKKAARKKKAGRKKPLLKKRSPVSTVTQRQTRQMHAPADSLGEWPADSAEDTVDLEISEDDEIPPEYGGSE